MNFLLFLFLEILFPCFDSQIYSIPINFTNGLGPLPRQYHTGFTFETWNKTNMDNTCEYSFCGPFCNSTDSSCIVPNNTDPVYLNKILPKTTDGNYTIQNIKCSNECCSEEYCYRALNKNGDDVTVPDEEVLLIFGGKVLNSLDTNTSCYWTFPIQLCNESLSNDLWFFFIKREQWSKIEPGVNPLGSSAMPSNRYGHQSVFIKRNVFESDSNSTVLRKYMYVYGGLSMDNGGEACDDLWVYEIPWAAQRYYPTPTNSSSFWNRGNHWRQINFGGGPGPRAFHSMAADPTNFEYVYLFGGVYQNGSDYSYSNDLWRFSVVNETWEKINVCGISSIDRSVKLWDGNSISGFVSINDDIYTTDTIQYATVNSSTFANCYNDTVNLPSCRGFSNLQMDENGILYIFGGSQGSIEYLNDIWIINAEGTDCAFEATPNIFIQDLNDLAIETYYYPPSLSSSSGVYFETLNYMFQYGGFNENGTSSDLWLFMGDSRLWYNHSDDFQTFFDIQNNISVNIPSLKGHILAKTSEGLIVHGGVTYNQIIDSNTSNYTQNFIDNFSTTCQIFINSQLSRNNIQSINQSIYRELLFLAYSGNPCFKESPSFAIYPDTYYPDYSYNIYVFNACNESIDSSRGQCYFGHYYCSNGYYGETCENVLCDNSICFQDIHAFAEPDCQFCSKHGSCSNGVCTCDVGYTGENCSIVDCENNCSGVAGQCVTQFVQNQCNCDIQEKRGYDDCSIVFCLNDCSDNGKCFDGVCFCNGGFNGTDCSVYNISLLDFGEKMVAFILRYLFILMMVFIDF